MRLSYIAVRHTSRALGLRVALSCAASLMALVAACAQTTFDYSVQPRTIRACRLLVPYQTAGGTWAVQASDEHSLMFEGMRRLPGKPAGWEIVNPQAPAAATLANPGVRILPSTPAYWEVVLDPNPNPAPDPLPLSDTTPPIINSPANPAFAGPQLDKFDLIYIWGGPPGNPIQLDLYRPEWRAALQRAVYNGAVLWVDGNLNLPAGGLDPVANFSPPGPLQSRGEVAGTALPPFNFAYGGTPTIGAVRGIARSLIAPVGVGGAGQLLSYPFQLRDIFEAPYIGRHPRWTMDTVPPTEDFRSASMDRVILNDPNWQPVLQVATTSAVPITNAAVRRYGSGAIVVTAGDVGHDVVGWWLWSQRNRPLGHEAPDCKFAWNVAALSGGSQQAQGNAQAQAASTVGVPGPLGIGWQYPDRFNNSATDPEARLGPVVSAPVHNKGLVYSVSLPYRGTPLRQAQLMCFDAEPARDLDGDGRADDAVTAADLDYSLGRSYDRVWSVDLGAGWTPRTAAPCVATIADSGNIVDAVLVSVVREAPAGGSVGEVRAYNALNGVFLWREELTPYNTGAGSKGMVVDLSTPVFHEGVVYVLASEFDPDIDSGNAAECAYGRAHALAAGARWVYPDPTDNPAWSLDSDVTNATSGDHAAPESAKSLPPFQDPLWVAAVGPFDPRPEIPPFPTPRPVMVQPTGPMANSGVQIMLRCSAPVSLKASGTARETDIDAAAGGSDYYLIPTPWLPGANQNAFNPYAFRVLLPEGVTASRTRPRNDVYNVCRVDDENIDSIGSGIWQDPADGRVYMYFHSGPARELLLPSLGNTNPNAAPNGITDPLLLATDGVAIMTPGNAGQSLEYEVFNGATWELKTTKARLNGMVRAVHKLPVNQRLVTSGSAWQGGGLYATDTIEGNSGVLRDFDYDGTYDPDNVSAYSGGPGTIGVREAETGVVRWQYRPTSALRPDPVGTPMRAQLAKGGFAVERSDETAYAAVTSALRPGTAGATGQIPQVLGLNMAPRLQVQLTGAAGSEVRIGKPFAITTISSDGAAEVAVPETVTNPATGAITRLYQLDPTSRMITFNAQLASWVNGTIGSLWGKPIWVNYSLTDPASPADAGGDTQINSGSNPEQRLHVLPDMLRFQYTPGAIRLKHGMVGAITNAGNRVPMAGFYLPNGVPLQRDPLLSVDEPIFFAQLDGLPGAWTGVLPRGILDVSNLRFGNGEAVPPGTEIMVEYDYWDPVTRIGATARERHQVPVRFGGSLSSPVLADRTLHLGTQGYLPSGLRGDAYPLLAPDSNPIVGFNSVRKSLLSVMMDPITGTVRGSLGQTAIPVARYSDDTADSGTPVVEGAVSVDGGGLVVGSNLMTRLGQISDHNASDPGYQTEGAGFVSRMKPQRTLICDNTRLIEVVGQKQSWVCAGSLAPVYHEALEPTNLGNQELKTTPFSRPAKAIYLSNGNILVADTGNERVIEIDRQGRQAWPLDTYGYDYYTSTSNDRLDLERPSDCFRYYVEYGGGVRRTTTNGALLPIDRRDRNDWTTWTGTEVHTVIADPGNHRVVDVVTYLDIRRTDDTLNLLGMPTHRVDILTPGNIRTTDPRTSSGAGVGAVAGRDGTGRIAYTRAQPIFDPTPNSTHNVVGYLCVASNLHQLVVVEHGTRWVNPPASRALPNGTAGTTWGWLAWLYDPDPADGRDISNNPLVFRNIRDVQLSLEYPSAFVTVTCGQFAGRLQQIAPNIPPHFLAEQGAGVFEYAINVGSAPGNWGRYATEDADPTMNPAVSTDDPIWWFTRLNYIYRDVSAGSRRSLTNLRYADNDGSIHLLDMPWNPVSAIRLPADRRPIAGQRQARHLVTNYAELTQNLNRNNVRSAASDAAAPASLFSSVLVIDTDDRNDFAPDNDAHDLDRREVIPDPADADWSDPFNQPTYADRG